MITIFKKISIVFIASFVVINLLSYIILSNRGLSNYFKVQSIGEEVYNAIKISNTYKSNTDTIVIGDSVARQIILVGLKDNLNVIDLTCNQAISLAGHYLLLVNAINKNPQVHKVFLLFHVDSFGNDLDQIFTYNYFVKPFYIDNEQQFSKNTIDIIRSNYLWVLYKLPMAKVLPVFREIDYSRSHIGEKHDLSATSVEYLKKINEICQSHNISLSVVPVPISNKKSRSYERLNAQIKELGFSNMFHDYLNKLIVLDDEFYRDSVHLKDNYVKFVSTFSMDYVGLLKDNNK